MHLATSRARIFGGCMQICKPSLLKNSWSSLWHQHDSNKPLLNDAPRFSSQAHNNRILYKDTNKTLLWSCGECANNNSCSNNTTTITTSNLRFSFFTSHQHRSEARWYSTSSPPPPAADAEVDSTSSTNIATSATSKPEQQQQQQQQQQQLQQQRPYRPRWLPKDKSNMTRAEKLIEMNKKISKIIKKYNGDMTRAIRILEQMKANTSEDATKPDAVTYTIILKGWLEQKNFEKAVEVLREMKEQPDPSAKPTVVTYNSLISALCKADHLHLALRLADDMLKNGIKFDVATFNTLIDAYCRRGMIDSAIKLFEKMLKVGITPDLVTFNALINGLCKAGDVDKAIAFLHQIKKNPEMKLDGFTYNPILKEYIARGRADKAIALFEEMNHPSDGSSAVKPDFVTYTVLMQAYVKYAQVPKAIALLEEMRSRCVRPDAYTLSALVDALCKAGEVDLALDILNKIMRKYNFNNDIRARTSIIAELIKNDREAEAMELWAEMRQELDLVAYSSTISAYCQLAIRQADSMKEYSYSCARALSLLEEMQSKGFHPNELTYTPIVHMFCKLQNMPEAERWVRQMRQQGIRPSEAIYAILIEGYGTTQDLDAAFACHERYERSVENSGYRGSSIDGSSEDGSSDPYDYDYDSYDSEGNIVVNRNNNKNNSSSGSSNSNQSRRANARIRVLNALIIACGRCGDSKRALQLFKSMDALDLAPTISSYNALMQALGLTGDVESAAHIFYNLTIKNAQSYRVIVYDVCLRNGHRDLACKVLLRLLEKLSNKVGSSGGVTTDLDQQLVMFLVKDGRKIITEVGTDDDDDDVIDDNDNTANNDNRELGLRLAKAYEEFLLILGRAKKGETSNSNTAAAVHASSTTVGPAVEQQLK